MSVRTVFKKKNKKSGEDEIKKYIFFTWLTP